MSDVQQCTILTTQTAVEVVLQSDSLIIAHSIPLNHLHFPLFPVTQVYSTLRIAVWYYCIFIRWDIQSASVRDGPWYGFKLVGDNLDKNLNMTSSAY